MTVVRVSEQTRRIKQLEAEVEQLWKENRQLREDTTPVGFLDREERIEQAVEAGAKAERDAYTTGTGQPLADWSDLTEAERERECASVRRIVEAAAPFLESSPAPDEVAVAAKRLVDTIDGMQKGAEKMGGQWYFPDLVLEDRDALRAALNEQEQA